MAQVVFVPHGVSMISTTCPSPSPTTVRFADLRRDRVADLVRIVSLGVVIVWHSTLSLFNRTNSGELTMPNPVGDYRGLWLITWVLQVMPLFFVVSGAVNADAWDRYRRRGGTARGFAIHRVARFAAPLSALLGVSIVAEAFWRAAFHASFLQRYQVLLVPLWTLGLLIAYAPITPLLARAWRHWGATSTVAGIAGVVLSDLVRFRAGGAATHVAEVVSTLGVWLVAYQLGWVYRAAVRSGDRQTGRIFTLVGIVGLVVSTNIGVYPRPMVATTTDAMSNLLPTTVPIMMLALFQCGLLLLLRPTLAAWCDRDRVRNLIDRLGAHALPAYLFHMVAVLVVVCAAESCGVRLSGHPSATWWLTRPIWLAIVAAVLVPILGGIKRLGVTT